MQNNRTTASFQSRDLSDPFLTGSMYSSILTKSASPISARTTPIAPVAMQHRRVCPDPQHPAAILNAIREC